MSCQLLIEKSAVNTKEIKVVLDRNGYKRARLDETKDYDGRVVKLTVPIEDYKYIQNNVGTRDDHVKEIFAAALTHPSLPDGYKVLAVLKDSLSEEVSD